MPADLVAVARNHEVREAWWGLRRAAASRPPHTQRFEAIRSARAVGLPAAALTFGDTPISLALSLLRAAGVTTGDTVVDPLAGRGHVLLAARLLGAQARGLEIDPSHVELAAPILAGAGAVLEAGDGRAVELAGATCVFLSWTCVDAEARGRIGARLAALSSGARIVALTWEPSGHWLEVVRRERRWFPWGICDVIHARRA